MTSAYQALRTAGWVPLVSIEKWCQGVTLTKTVKAFINLEWGYLLFLACFLLLFSVYWLPACLVDRERRAKEWVFGNVVRMPEDVWGLLRHITQPLLHQARAKALEPLKQASRPILERALEKLPKRTVSVDETANAANGQEELNMVKADTKDTPDTTTTLVTPATSSTSDAPDAPNTPNTPNTPTTSDASDSLEQINQPQESPLDHNTQGLRRTNRDMPPRGRTRTRSELVEWIDVTVIGCGLGTDRSGDIARHE